jgi:hypothetical protein
VEPQSSFALLWTSTEIDEDQNEALRWYLKAAQQQQINRIAGSYLTRTRYVFTDRQSNISVTFVVQRDEDISLIDSQRKEYLYENDNFNNQ